MKRKSVGGVFIEYRLPLTFNGKKFNYMKIKPFETQKNKENSFKLLILPAVNIKRICCLEIHVVNL